MSFPHLVVPRKLGLAGITQYEVEFEKQLLPTEYKPMIDFIDHAKGVQKNAVYLAHVKKEILITPDIAISVIAFWRLCSLVFFNMLNADYLLCGMMQAFYHGAVFGSDIDKLLWKYLNDHLRAEYSDTLKQKE